MLALYSTEYGDSPYAPGKRADHAAGERLISHMLASCGAPAETEVGRHGKPFSPSRRDISFNISHSRGLCVGAILTENMGEVGVDVEFIDREKRLERIAERFFTERERAEIGAANDGALAFYLIWTMKEAYLKYLGTGITSPLGELDTALVGGVRFDSRVIQGPAGEYAFTVCTGERAAETKNVLIIKIF